ncbi:speedy protein A-like [Mantella aurantiaca]
MSSRKISDSRILQGGKRKRKEKHLGVEDDTSASCSSAQIFINPPLKRKKFLDITKNERSAFYRLFKHPYIKGLLAMDSCLLIADNRAGLTIQEYTVLNFFTALSWTDISIGFGKEIVHHTMEEPGRNIASTLDSGTRGCEHPYIKGLLAMDSCLLIADNVMDGHQHWIWKRDRPPHHGGARKEHRKHPGFRNPGMRRILQGGKRKRKEKHLGVEDDASASCSRAHYLANQMEEDKYMKGTMEKFGQLCTDLESFKDGQRKFFRKMNMQAWVSRKECNQVMDGHQHWIWKRDRPPHHGGARKEHRKHPGFRNPGMRYKCPLCH